MAELPPDEGQLNGGDPPPSNAALASVSAVTAVGSKRQRRPSVRLGEIGGDQYHQAYDSHARRSTGGNKQWRPLNSRKEPNPSSEASRTRALTNLSSDYNTNNNETLEEDREGNLDSMAIASWRVKKRVGSAATTKRVRSNWVSKNDENRNVDNSILDQGDEKYSVEEELEDGYRDFTREDLESPLKEQSPIDSPGNRGNNERDGFYTTNNIRRYNNINSFRARVSENREFEISEPSDMDGREWRRGGGGREGVRIWLDGLGLGRYWPVFEIHEVDDEVLPLLTLEDLKDMGINAVGSRRKMYCAIQTLGKEFS